MYLNKKLHNKYKVHLNCNSHILKYGSYGLKAQSFSVLTESKIDFLQRFLNKLIKKLSKSSRSIKCWNRIQVNSTLTSLSPESRMGKGKGAICNKISHIKQGQILFEFSSISFVQVGSVCKNLNTKLPFNVKLIKRSV